MQLHLAGVRKQGYDETMSESRPRRFLARGHQPIPYDMFSRERADRERANAERLENIYHRGQAKAWDGRAVLSELVSRHGTPSLPSAQTDGLQRVLANIFWGELAAWRISADLAMQLVPLEAKMAATSQAHDEARHFYVLHDYLQLLGHEPAPLPPRAARLLDEVANAPDLVRKLLGMQLMVEPLALTLFQLLRERRVEPVLTELLSYYERDEARHVALGALHLPTLMSDLSQAELIALWRWQMHMFMLQIDGLVELAPSMAALGIDAREVYRLGQAKQLAASKMMFGGLAERPWLLQLFVRVTEARMAFSFPTEGQGPSARLRGAWLGLRHGPGHIPDTEIHAA